MDYNLGLKEVDSPRKLFLAIPEAGYDKIAQIPFLVKSLAYHKVKYIVFDPLLKKIVEWKE